MSPSSPVSVIAGSSVTLECAAVGDPSPAVQWIAPEDSRSSPQLIEGDRGVLKLVIEEASPKDQGNYTCQAENLVGITRESLELLGELLGNFLVQYGRLFLVFIELFHELTAQRNFCDVLRGSPRIMTKEEMIGMTVVLLRGRFVDHGPWKMAINK